MSRAVFCATALCPGAGDRLSPAEPPMATILRSLSPRQKPRRQKRRSLGRRSGRPHFFRYLQIMEMQPVTEDGHAGVAITAFEPGSYMDVKFT